MSDFWTDEKVETLKAGVAAGLSGSAVAVLLGCSRNAAISKCGRLGLVLMGRPRPGVDFATEADAAALGVPLTPDAPIGVARELRKPYRYPNPLPTPFDAPEPVEDTRTPFDLLEITPPTTLADGGVNLWGLRNNHCRAITVGGPEDIMSMRYCGAPTVDHGSWCAEHAKRFTRTVMAMRAERKAEKEAKQAKLGRWA